jgi:hypothetical protein
MCTPVAHPHRARPSCQHDSTPAITPQHSRWARSAGPIEHAQHAQHAQHASTFSITFSRTPGTPGPSLTMVHGICRNPSIFLTAPSPHSHLATVCLETHGAGGSRKPTNSNQVLQIGCCRFCLPTPSRTHPPGQGLEAITLPKRDTPAPRACFPGSNSGGTAAAVCEMQGGLPSTIPPRQDIRFLMWPWKGQREVLY